MPRTKQTTAPRRNHANKDWGFWFRLESEVGLEEKHINALACLCLCVSVSVCLCLCLCVCACVCSLSVSVCVCAFLSVSVFHQCVRVYVGEYRYLCDVCSCVRVQRQAKFSPSRSGISSAQQSVLSTTCWPGNRSQKTIHCEAVRANGTQRRQTTQRTQLRVNTKRLPIP